MRFFIFFLLIVHFHCACNFNSQGKKSIFIKQYRNNVLIQEMWSDKTQFIDTGVYCLVHYDSSQTKILDSSFYLNGVLNGYSFRRENGLVVMGNYKNGKKSGWFDNQSNGSIIQSNYYSNDTLYQSTNRSSGTLDSITIHVPDINETFLLLSNRDVVSNTWSGWKVKKHDSLLLYVITGVNRLQNSRYNISDDLNNKIIEFNNSDAAYFKFKISNKIFNKYYLILKTYNGDSLIHMKKDLIITTPFERK